VDVASRHAHGHAHHHADAHTHVHAGHGPSLVKRVMQEAGRAGLPEGVATAGARVIARILAAEGKVHGATPRHVHLHELEDLDTVVDVFGVMLALHELGSPQVYASPVTVGTGRIHVAHGELPVPAPGTAELLRGASVRFGVGEGELATPTGAALLAGIAGFEAPPPFTVTRVGYGAGAREIPGRPNLLRAILGEASVGEADGEIRQVEAVVDDMSPQLVEAFLDRAYRVGAVEAWTSPVQVKRSRPGVAITALAPPSACDAVIRAFLEETGTLGVRVSSPRRVTLDRRIVVRQTRWGAVRFKVAGRGASLHAIPEYRDVARLAARSGVPARLILDELKGGWQALAQPKMTKKHKR
jgi:uncharacterized protein (TIGR00299 family) protein